MTIAYIGGGDPASVNTLTAQLESSGYRVVVPMHDAGPTWRRAMVAQADEVVLLPGWENDKNAVLESDTAFANAKPIWFAHRDRLVWQLFADEPEDMPAPVGFIACRNPEQAYADGVGRGPDPELERLLDEEEEIQRHLDAQAVVVTDASGRALDHEGLHTDSPSMISTWTHKRVDPLNMRPEDFDLHDIAHALARACRYNGHVGGFLSVARHSIWVSNRLRAEGPLLRLYGLLHDASEAYLGDMVKPLKHDPSMARFVEAELALEKVLAEKFGFPFPMPDVVKEADRFVTVEVELGIRLRDSFGLDADRQYELDEDDFLDLYYEIQDEMS